MAFIGFSVPQPTARVLSEIDVPGEKTAPDHMHITVVNLGKQLPMETLSRAMEVAYSVASQVRPFTVRVDRVTTFPKNDDGVPIICRVESETLQEIWRRLCSTLDEMGIEYSKKFPVFNPHVTLSFSPDAIPDRDIPPVEWGAHELVLWGGDHGSERLIVHLPFSLRDRVASRFRRPGLVQRVIGRFRAGDRW